MVQTVQGVGIGIGSSGGPYVASASARRWIRHPSRFEGLLVLFPGQAGP